MSTRDLPHLPADDLLSAPARGQGHGGIVQPTQQGQIATHEWRLDQLRRIHLPAAATRQRFQVESGVAGGVVIGAKTNPGIVYADSIMTRIRFRFDVAPTGAATVELWVATTSTGAYALAISRSIAAGTVERNENVAIFVPRREGRFQWRVPTPAGMAFVTFLAEFET